MAAEGQISGVWRLLDAEKYHSLNRSMINLLERRRQPCATLCLSGREQRRAGRIAEGFAKNVFKHERRSTFHLGKLTLMLE